MDEKQVDNLTIDEKELDQIDKQIDLEKQELKKVEDMQEELFFLNKNMNNCIGLLSKSMKGPNTDKLFSGMQDNNNIVLSKTTNILDEYSEEITKKINNLLREKEDLMEEDRKEVE